MEEGMKVQVESDVDTIPIEAMLANTETVVCTECDTSRSGLRMVNFARFSLCTSEGECTPSLM